MKDLILGFAKGYSIRDLLLFICSLEKTTFRGDVVLFIEDISNATCDFLRSRSVKLIRTERFLGPNLRINKPHPGKVRKAFNRMPSLLRHVLLRRRTWHCSITRYYYYYEYLCSEGIAYSKVMLSDVGDVFFQRDPFDFTFESGLCVFEEESGSIIEDDIFNSNWVKMAFGEKGMFEIGHRQIYCSGVTIGSREGVVEYLRKMIGLLALSLGNSGVDQGVLNYLVHNNQLVGVTAFSNDAGPVCSLALKPETRFAFSEQGLLVNCNDVEYNVLHQYNRHNDLHNRLKRLVV